MVSVSSRTTIVAGESVVMTIIRAIKFYVCCGTIYKCITVLQLHSLYLGDVYKSGFHTVGGRETFWATLMLNFMNACYAAALL